MHGKARPEDSRALPCAALGMSKLQKTKQTHGCQRWGPTAASEEAVKGCDKSRWCLSGRVCVISTDSLNRTWGRASSSQPAL